MPEQPRKQADLKPNRLTGVKKRQQIEVAGRTMFIWVAIAAVALSICVATGQYLFTKWNFNNKIIGQKNTTAQTLNNNISNAQKLKQQVDDLTANQDLASVKTNPNDPNTKSVLDALPTTADSAALATSLQQVILNRSGVSVESINIPPDSDTGANNNGSQPQEMKFSVVVSGPYDKIKAMVNDFNRTIRPMKIKSMTLNGSDANLRATLDVVTYYQPAKSVSLSEEVVK